MNDTSSSPVDDRLVSMDYIAERVGISVRELRRNIPQWSGFPKAVKLGHRTVRFSLDGFNRWFEHFKSGQNQPA
jgi:predicted DNA-binding transcriptional regulator AlpA